LSRAETQPITIERQRELIGRLTQLAARRSTEGAAAAHRHAARVAAARREHQQRREEQIADFERRYASVVAEYQAARETIFSRYEAEGFGLIQEEIRSQVKADQEQTESLAALKTVRHHQSQEVIKGYRAQKAMPRREYAAFKQRALAAEHEVTALLAKAQAVVRRRAEWPQDAIDKVPVPPLAPGQTKQQYMEQFTAAVGRAVQRLAAIENLPAARFIEEGWLLLTVLFVAPLAAFLFWWFLREPLGPVGVLVACLLTTTAITIAAWQMARPVARKQTLQLIPEFQQAIAEANANLAAALAAAKAAGEEAHQKVVEHRDAELAAAKAEYKQRRKESKSAHAAAKKRAEAQFGARRKIIEDKYERQLDELDRTFPGQIEAVEREFKQKMTDAQSWLNERAAESDDERQREQEELITAWSQAVSEFEQAAAAMNEVCDHRFAPWNEIGDQKAGQAAKPVNGQPAEMVAALRFGRFSFAMPVAEMPTAEQSSGQHQPYTLPAVLSYPGRPSLLIEAEGDGREAATRVLQNVMLRLLTTFPPGKVRFTIIDPVGLGQNFSAFMHLADYDEKLVNSRIWTEANHIQQRLADLTQHMENVIQKYLRNEFSSIQEYNAHAGEVAEPFQILVVANFPANFSEEAARRLAAINSSGARCGVYTLITTDTKLALPRNFDLADLEASAATVVWNADQRRFAWKSDDLKNLPLTMEEPPDDERFTQIVRRIGGLAKDAARVEVPFEMVTPPADRWWTADSRDGVEVALGRAGAKNLQYMRLGKGTSQHVLISGKTGSGKSTLLNALITNLAMYYSPDELEFYLIDFKKGVEFKAYAACKLPHARVIAIESEREFGMSVLERLDQELKRRGDLFRKAGVQDLKAYRNAIETSPLAGSKPGPGDAASSQTLPRVLLIIDEFQEFFTTDDRVAHDAALLLDRLVRQGRAFGIHVLLGSQTLAGAYSLARSTLGQMAVRIALQCSETDAHLILSEDNTAARLLSRPGEAIYNDANGLFEGNHPFQVVWLSDGEREDYLLRIAELAQQRKVSVPPPIVFEGNAAADPSENRLLAAALASPAPTGTAALRAWLGAAVAIKDPTEADFRPQNGSNLLIVGQQDELAIGMLSLSLISLAAQLPQTSTHHSPLTTRFTILDGTRADAPEAGHWERLCRQLPLSAKVVLPKDAVRSIGELAEEVNRRLSAGEETAEPLFLVIHNLARFRDLKKGDDFSFDDSAESSGAKDMTTILREGPAAGVHTVVWCDSLTNVSRWLDRQALRDFDMRVLMQMSANDSSNLMDSPAASKLGGHTAIFYSEERGQAEKFRPYGLPTNDWLSSVAGRLKSKD
jgi:S-DNA-T family DNA segregation ATPase FtsK/SpoIIIE